MHGFRYFDRRDLLGFVDGTENPVGPAVDRALLVGDDDPDFAGGSYVVIQKYLHDLAAWNAMSRRAAGGQRSAARSSPTSSCPTTEKAPAPHTALTSIEDEDGTELQILRDNMPFGSVAGAGEYGTYFIGYTRDPGVIERMLRNMFIGDPPGTTTGCSRSPRPSPARSSSCRPSTSSRATAYGTHPCELGRIGGSWRDDDTRDPGRPPGALAGQAPESPQGACFMEMASVLANEPWSDRPRCTHPLLSQLAAWSTTTPATPAGPSSW